MADVDRSKAPAYQWYPGDFRRDTAVQACSFEARALWREMLDLMHDGEPYGHLAAGGIAITPEQLGRMIGVQPARIKRWMAELEERKVFSRTDSGAVYSRRMVRDEDIRRKRAAGGKLGGNPALMGGGKVEEKVNLPPNLPPNLLPTPASASAVAVATTTDGGADAPPKPSARKARQLPADWEPNDDHRKLAATLLNVRLSVEVQKFRDHFTANGKPMKDWDAAFRNWLRRAQEFAPVKPAPTSEAAAVRDELPRSTAPRQGMDPIDARRRQEAEENERVNAWSQQHEGEAAALYADIREELAGDGTWRGAPAKMLDAKLHAEYRRRVLDKLRPVAA